MIDHLLADPEIALAVGLLARLALAYQRGLSWPEYRVAHRLKRGVFPLLDRVEPFGFSLFVTEKLGHDDPEYLRTVDAPPKAVVSRLRAAGGSLHVLNALKRRPSVYGDPLTAAHVVWSHDDGTQTECYVFANTDGSTDIYSHAEASVTDPDDHVSGEGQIDGDPRGVVRDALDA